MKGVVFYRGSEEAGDYKEYKHADVDIVKHARTGALIGAFLKSDSQPVSIKYVYCFNEVRPFSNSLT